jgi:hypothetical protein
VAHAARVDAMPAPAMLPTPEPHIRFIGAMDRAAVRLGLQSSPDESRLPCGIDS